MEKIAVDIPVRLDDKTTYNLEVVLPRDKKYEIKIK